MFPKSLSCDYRAQRSSALVITLAAVVLISAIILVFFGQSTLHRQMSYTSAGQYRADLIAHTGLDTIVGDLRNEIAAGSTITTNSSGTNIYVPTANITVVPYQVANQGFTNLVKQSASSLPFWSAVNYPGGTAPVRSAANNSSSTTSLNGRSISLNEWNRPGLLGDRGSGTTPVMPAIPSYTPPDWVIVTRQGPIANSASPPMPAAGPAAPGGTGNTLADKGAGNMSYAIGRYAYTIYDEGGLLDVNVAGIPSSATPNFSAKRGLLAQVDLGNLLSNPVINDPNASSDANALVKWRNASTYSTTSPATLYTNYVLGNINGFTTVANGDQTFVSRQDLIKYTLPPSSGFPTSALQYLGTFSRELNAPSYTPPASQPNPSLINTRITTTPISPRYSDGTTGNLGEPLIKYRFPLSRLNWIGHAGYTGTTVAGSAVADADTRAAFGLTYVGNGVWNYIHGNPIMSLAAVAAAGREPDFFELLQAGILAGSLGQTQNNTYSFDSNYDSSISLQVLQIGANLIDQYDSTDSYPTRITLGGGTEVDGIQNLPYLVSVYATPYQIPGPSPAAPGTIGVWLQPEVWNPHAPPTTIPPGPTQFRFIVANQGTVQVTFSNPSFTPPSKTFLNPSLPNPPPLNDPWGIRFSSSTVFNEPTFLTPANATAPGSTPAQPDQESSSNANFLGLSLGTPISEPAAPNPPYTSAGFTPLVPLGAPPNTVPSITFQLQYWDGAEWVTYSQMKYVVTSLAMTDPNYFATYSPKVCITRSDPRTDRFGIVTSSATPINSTLWPIPGSASYATSGPAANTTWPKGTGFIGTLSDNKTSSSTYYIDPDLIERPADGAYTDGNVVDGGYPLATGATASRPYILNRPFQSVAEMGYAFRDEPWKHLDFFTTGSADAALLDLFCLNESPRPPNPTVFPSAIAEAGRVDLNTRQTTVLQAVLEGVIMSEDDSTTIAAPEAKNLASNLTTLTTTLPLLNRSELVTRWISAVPTTTFDSTSDAIIKRRREAAVRALADVGNTRTWNLLIDVIAQSGRYGPTAANLNQFIVEGERRYWLHVAIDRYTNEVVAQYLEPVYE